MVFNWKQYMHPVTLDPIHKSSPERYLVCYNLFVSHTIALIFGYVVDIVLVHMLTKFEKYYTKE